MQRQKTIAPPFSTTANHLRKMKGKRKERRRTKAINIGRCDNGWAVEQGSASTRASEPIKSKLKVTQIYVTFPSFLNKLP